jgi:hypothetical protein
MNFKFNMKTLAVALMIAMAPLAMPAYSASPNPAIVQQTFAAPEDAAKALAEAVRANDVNALLAVVGPKSRNWLFSGDEVADRDAWGKFLTAYDQKERGQQGGRWPGAASGWRWQLGVSRPDRQ